MLLFISFPEIIVILVVSIILFGPKKLPEIARGLGQAVRAMKNATEDIKKEIMKEAGDLDKSKEIQEEIQKAKNIVEETVEDIDTSIGPIKR